MAGVSWICLISIAFQVIIAVTSLSSLLDKTLLLISSSGQVRRLTNVSPSTTNDIGSVEKINDWKDRDSSTGKSEDEEEQKEGNKIRQEKSREVEILYSGEEGDDVERFVDRSDIEWLPLSEFFEKDGEYFDNDKQRVDIFHTSDDAIFVVNSNQHTVSKINMDIPSTVDIANRFKLLRSITMKERKSGLETEVTELVGEIPSDYIDKFRKQNGHYINEKTGQIEDPLHTDSYTEGEILITSNAGRLVERINLHHGEGLVLKDLQIEG